MGKIIVTEFITLDGVIEAPGGDETPHRHAGWQSKYKSPEGGKYKMDELASVDALLLGKNTFEAFAAYWPSERGRICRPHQQNAQVCRLHKLAKDGLA